MKLNVVMVNKRRRILYIQLPTGGGSTISLYELVKGLDNLHYEPVVLFILKNKYQDVFKDLGVQTFTLNSKGYCRNNSSIKKISNLFFFDIPLAFYIARLIKKEHIDLVHSNVGFIRAVMIASIITGTPQVCHFRNFQKTIPLMTRVLMPSVDATLYTTQAIADHYSKLKGCVRRQSIVYEPIDIKRFSQHHDTGNLRQQFLVGDTGYLISNIGRITPWKGQHYFLEAMANVVIRYPNIKILIIGEHGNNRQDKEYFNTLQDVIKKASMENYVVFTGNRNDIPEIMSASDIVVHSACLPEPFGLVIAESMAAGTPVVATRGGGTPEIIEDGVTGLFAPIKSAEGIQKAVEKLLKDSALRENIKVKAKEVVAARFSIEQHVAKVQKIYDDVFSTH